MWLQSEAWHWHQAPARHPRATLLTTAWASQHLVCLLSLAVDVKRVWTWTFLRETKSTGTVNKENSGKCLQERLWVRAADKFLPLCQ